MRSKRVGLVLANLADLQPFMSQTGPVPSSDILTLKNINEGALVADDFQFV